MMRPRAMGLVPSQVDQRQTAAGSELGRDATIAQAKHVSSGRARHGFWRIERPGERPASRFKYLNTRRGLYPKMYRKTCFLRCRRLLPGRREGWYQSEIGRAHV